MKKILLFASAVAVLFSSCSTDSTSDVIGNEAKMGAVSATAAYQQDGTRTEYDGQNVLWSKGDAIGIFNAVGVQVQFGLTEGAGTATGKFEGNTNYLTVKEPAVAYYPYDKNTTFAYGVLSLEIAGKQTFLKADSWDAAMAPAIGYTVVEDKDDIKFKFEGVASYVTIPVKGMGTLKSLSLNIGNQQLYGTGTVDFNNTPFLSEEEGASYAMVMDANQDNHTITVNCGGNVKLDPFNAQKILFVIPAGVNLHQAEITVTAELVGAEKPISHYTTKNIADETKRVTVANAKANLTYEGGAWSFGLEGKYVIDSDTDATNEYDDKLTAEERFLAYAYLTKPGQADVTDFTDYIYAAKALDLENVEDIATIEALVFADEINFAGLDKNWANAQAEAAHAAEYKAAAADKAKHLFWQSVYEWYAMEGAIESLSYNAVIGAPISGNSTATIKNLKVVGTGISNGASLENLTFEAIEVTTESKDAVGLIAPSSAMKSTPNPKYGEETDMVIKNVIIAADNSVNAPNASIVGGIYGSFNDTNKIAAASAIEIKSAAKATHVGRLYGLIEGVTTNVTIELGGMAYGVHESVKDYFVVGRFQSRNTLIADIVAPESAGMPNGGIVKSTAGSTIAGNTSYWNGIIATDDNASIYGGSTYFTAEQLAKVLSNNKVNKQYTLTHNIDMQCSYPVATIATEEETEEAVPGTGFDNASTVNDGQILKHYVHTSNAGIWIDGTEEMFEIKNIIANSESKGQGLFGYNAKISNLKISNVSLFVDGQYSYIAGLAQTGTAKNVVVDGLVINLAEDLTADADACDAIGGVFSVADALNVESVQVNNFSVLGAPATKLAVNFGGVFGTLNINPNYTTTLTGIKSTKINRGSDWFKNKQYNDQASKTYFVATKHYTGQFPIGVINVANAAFVENGIVEAYLKVADGNNTRLAAGVVFADKLTNAAADTVNFVAPASNDEKYHYTLYINGAYVGNDKYTVFGFNKAEEDAE